MKFSFWLNLPRVLLRHYLTKNRAEIGMTICGLVALVTPLLLWVSWSKEILQIVLIMGFSAFILATFFAQYACPDSVEPGEDDFPRPGEDDFPGPSELKTNKGSGDSNYREKPERGWRDHT